MDGANAKNGAGKALRGFAAGLARICRRFARSIGLARGKTWRKLDSALREEIRQTQHRSERAPLM
jgi:hypothetical protein